MHYEALGENFDVNEVVLKPALRVNTLKIKEEELVLRLRKKGVFLEKIPFLKHGYFYDAPFSLGSTPEYLFGYYYLQDPASQFVAEVLNPQKEVLDMCASPGSKTTYLAQLMNNQGTIVAVDNNSLRLKSLQNNLERCSVRNTITINKDANYVSDIGKFEQVLLDAPCSGNFCINPKYFSQRTPEDIQKKAEAQKKLLKEAFKASTKEIVYSTCSLEIQENELVVEWFLENFDVELVAIKGPGDSGVVEYKGRKLHKDIKKTMRFWPHKLGTQGFFVAKFLKK